MNAPNIPAGEPLARHISRKPTLITLIFYAVAIPCIYLAARGRHIGPCDGIPPWLMGIIFLPFVSGILLAICFSQLVKGNIAWAVPGIINALVFLGCVIYFCMGH